jgi:hypothetical protein
VGGRRLKWDAHLHVLVIGVYNFDCELLAHSIDGFRGNVERTAIGARANCTFTFTASLESLRKVEMLKLTSDKVAT